MPPTYTTTSKYGLRWLTGANVGLDIDAGFQALAEDLDAIIATADSGVLTSRPISTAGSPGKRGRFYYATDTAQLFFDYGTGWLDILLRPTVVTALPTANLYTGRIEQLQTAAMSAAGVGPWECRYHAGAVRWKVMRADPLYAENLVYGTTVNGFYADVISGGVAPSCVAPALGDYLVDHGCENYSDISGVNLSQSFAVGGTGALDADAALRTTSAAGVAPSVVSRTVRKNGVPAASALTLQWKVQVDTGHFGYRWMKVTPLWLG